MTEKQLLSSLRAGNELALDAAIQTYSRLLWSIARAVLHHVGTAEDMEECVADAFIQLWANSESLSEARGSVKTYLCVAVKSRAIDRYRKAVQRSEIALDEQLAELVAAPVGRAEEGVGRPGVLFSEFHAAPAGPSAARTRPSSRCGRTPARSARA